MAVVRGPGLLGPWSAVLHSPHQLAPPLTVPLSVQAENRSSFSTSDPRCGAAHFMFEWDCPPSCQFLEPVDSEEVCDFRCVRRCGSNGGELAWADREKRICTRCPLPGCMLCSSKDTCEQCYMSWAYVFSKGAKRCVLRLWHLSILFFGLLAVPVCVAAGWYASLHCRPLVNDDVRARAVIHADRLKLRDHRRHSHNWYPLRVNLLKPDERGNAIGGLGLALHFRFQLAALAWTLIALFTWLLVVFFQKGLLTTESGHGMSLVMNPAQVYALCNTSRVEVMSAQHKRIQGEAVMLAYTSIMYILTTLGALVFASYQRFFFTRLAARVTTMQDYALFLSGFPEEAGECVEEERADFVREVCGHMPVGVSVCWDFEDCEAELLAIVRWENHLRQRAQSRDSIRTADLRRAKGRSSRMIAVPDDMEDPRLRSRGCCRRLLLSAGTQLGKIDPLFLPGSCSEQRHGHELQAAAVKLLEDISSTEHTCVVFSSVQDRDAARERFNIGGPATMFKGRHRVWASGMEQDTEPDTVLWNFLGTGRASRRRKVALSILKIILAIGLWAGFLYLPWGYYVALHMETFGQLPSFATEAIFSLLVVLGNQLIYLVCNKAARSVAYNHTGEQEALYMFLYSIAILVNMAVDLCVIRWTSVKALDQFDMKVPMESLRHFMSHRLWKYNFPSCFLIPFMVEPMLLYILPFDVATRIIGTRDMGQSEADEILQPVPMDLSRYQDILLNVTQAICALFLEPKYVLQTWIGLIVGQLFIFCWDHYKVLRVVRAFNFSSFLSDRVSQRLTAIPCGMLGACVAYRYLHLRSLKARQTCGGCQGEAGVFSMDNFPLAMLVLVLHVGVHLFMLHRMVPTLKVTESSEEAWSKKPGYKEIATERPANYFNTNPVHCLRSRYLHNESPPCNFYIRGKEHLLEANPEIGQYYHAKRWDDKRKTIAVEMSVVTKSFCQSFAAKREAAGISFRRSVSSSDSVGGAVVVAGQLWKLNRDVAELLLAEHRGDIHQRPRASNASSHQGLGLDGSPPDGHRQTLVDGLDEGIPPWMSLAGWRLRFATLRDDGEGSGELTYCSERSETEVLACTLSRRNATMRVRPLPRLELEPMSATSKREMRLALRSYELAFVPDHQDPGFTSDESLPSELHPMAITWTDRTGVDRQFVLAHDRKERFEEWLGHLRSFCCSSADS